MKQHHFQITTAWTGNRGSGTAGYTGYSRNHEYHAPAKGAVIAGSSSPEFRGDATRYNPEELLVGAISSCHMLWVLHLCADAGIVVTAYSDHAAGEMMEHPDGSGEFTRVILRPHMTIADPARIGDATLLHDRARELCFLARSVRFPVEHQPVVTA
jgi:organic hydroperoxide reductase OsmC/OhrA